METFESLWLLFIVVAIAMLFAHQVWRGWRTGVVRFPVSVLAVEALERERAPTMFGLVMAADLLGAAAAMGVAIACGASAFPRPSLPIATIADLDGCYEGEGLPDFMRPPVHWEFRVAKGVLSDRRGQAMSTIRLLGRTAHATAIGFSPGISLAYDEHKNPIVDPGDIVSGQAYSRGGRTTIALGDDLGEVLPRTSCG